MLAATIWLNQRLGAAHERGKPTTGGKGEQSAIARRQGAAGHADKESQVLHQRSFVPKTDVEHRPQDDVGERQDHHDDQGRHDEPLFGRTPGLRGVADFGLVFFERVVGERRIAVHGWLFARNSAK